MSFELVLKKLGSISFLYSPQLFFQERVLVAFTLRHGGVSPAPFAALNLGLHVGDSEENVIANRLLLLSHLNLDTDRLTTAKQVHGNVPTIVEEKLAGRGAKSYEGSISGTDALITVLDNVPLALFFADCVPIVFVEPIKRCIAVVHAGWRGILNDIIMETISMLKKNFDVRPAELLAFLGPSIGGCCYEVDESLMKEFRERFDLHLPGIRLDLPSFAQMELKETGVLAERIFCTALCTSCQSDMFFSFRKAHPTGRQAGLVALLGENYEPPFGF